MGGVRARPVPRSAASGLPRKGNPVAGYRAADDKYATTKKVRFKAEDVIVRI